MMTKKSKLDVMKGKVIIETQEHYSYIRQSINSIIPISENDWKLVAESLVPDALVQNDYFVKEGSISRFVAFVIKGSFRTFFNKEGEEINQDFYFENTWVKSFHSFLKQEPSLLCVQAMEDSVIYKIEYNDLTRLYASSNTLNIFGRLITEYTYAQAQSRIESFLLSNTEQRYLKLLKEHPTIFERIPLYHIASYLGITQPSLSRLRARLVKK